MVSSNGCDIPISTVIHANDVFLFCETIVIFCMALDWLYCLIEQVGVLVPLTSTDNF